MTPAKQQAEVILAQWRSEGREINDELVQAVATALAAKDKRIKHLEDELATATELRKGYETLTSIATSQIKDRDAEIERLKAAHGQCIADLMGCRDGALVRDLRCEIEQLKKAEIAALRSRITA